MEITKTYVGTMLIEDFNKLSYKERGEYLNTLEGLLVESEESFNIEEECTDINCSIEEYAQQYNYVTLEELRERMNNIQENAQTQNADNKPNT